MKKNPKQNNLTFNSNSDPILHRATDISERAYLFIGAHKLEFSCGIH